MDMRDNTCFVGTSHIARELRALTAAADSASRGQPEKAYLPIVVRLSGSVTAVRAEQRLKACLPIEVRLSGSVTAARESQPLNV